MIENNEKEAIIDESVEGEPIVDDPVADEPIESEPVEGETGEDEPTVDEPVGGKPNEGEPAEDDPVVEEPTEGETEADKPTEPTTYTDDDGTWEDYGNGIKALVEPSDAWREANQDEKPEPPPKKLSVWDELAAAYAEGVNSLDK